MKKYQSFLLAFSIILISFNLRAPITAIGPIINIIKENFNLSLGISGLLTTIPLLTFAFVSPYVAHFSKKHGYPMIMLIGLIMLFIGLLIRSYMGISGLFVGTLLLGSGIAIGNVLLPGIIKMKFPQKMGLMISLYTSSMSTFASIGSGVSVPLSKEYGWQISLAIWSILTIVTIFFWIPELLKKDNSSSVQRTMVPADKKKNSIWKSKLAWSVTLYMGLQSFSFYGLATWLPSIMMSKGLSEGMAGNMLFLYQIVGLPAGMIIPSIAYRCKGQRILTLISSAILFVSLTLLLWASSLSSYTILIILIGFTSATNLSLAISFLSLRVSSSQKSIELSGMSQSVGYLLAALAPILMGLGYDWIRDWNLVLGILIIATILLLVFGFKAAENLQVKD